MNLWLVSRSYAAWFSCFHQLLFINPWLHSGCPSFWTRQAYVGVRASCWVLQAQDNACAQVYGESTFSWAIKTCEMYFDEGHGWSSLNAQWVGHVICCHWFQRGKRPTACNRFYSFCVLTSCQLCLWTSLYTILVNLQKALSAVVKTSCLRVWRKRIDPKTWVSSVNVWWQCLVGRFPMQLYFSIFSSILSVWLLAL